MDKRGLFPIWARPSRPFLPLETRFLALVIGSSHLKPTWGGLNKLNPCLATALKHVDIVQRANAKVPSAVWEVLQPAGGGVRRFITEPRQADNLQNDFWALCALICAVKPECHSGSLISIQSISPDLLLSSVLLPPDLRRHTSRETPRPRTERQPVAFLADVEITLSDES